MNAALSRETSVAGGGGVVSARVWGAVIGVYGAWLGVAVLRGEFGVLTEPPAGPRVIGAAIVLFVAAQVLAYMAVPAFRALLRAIDLRWLVLMHIGRLFGALFLVYHAQGRLAGGFAIPAGWADIAVAVGAVVIALGWMPPNTPGRRRAVAVWNALGLLDILAAPALGLWHALTRPESMAAMSDLPLAVVPVFLVPMYIASHLLIAARLREAGRGA